MARTLPTLDEPDLEIALLRKSVGELTADRHLCADCGRTPLVGERMYRFSGHGTVCALCRRDHRAEPDASVLVRHSERGFTVRRITPRAA